MDGPLERMWDGWTLYLTYNYRHRRQSVSLPASPWHPLSRGDVAPGPCVTV